MQFYIETLGCKVNFYESEAVASILESNDFVRKTSDEGDLDLIIVNTCSVTMVADQKCRKAIRKHRLLNPNAILIVMGCYAQVSYKTLLDLGANINIILGSKYKANILDLIDEFLNNRQIIVKIDDSNSITQYEELKVCKYEENTRAFLKIQDGCNNFCSYCLIPYTRGRSRSRNKNDILNEATYLVSNGYKEIVLTGIHTDAYGKDLENYTFVDLLKDLVKVKGLERIRISSIEESEISDELINLIQTNPIIVPHLHIPLQSGCDKILKLMNRRYDCAAYFNKISKIKRLIPDIAITTDVIVGFPTESESDFNITYEFIKKVGFAMLHVFPYSIRPGTVASKFAGQVDKQTKKKRVDKLIKLNDELANAYIETFKDKTLKVLFETKEKDLIKGHAENYFEVCCKGDESLLNKIVEVEITKPSYPLSYGIIKKR